jgi:hypothetical protein
MATLAIHERFCRPLSSTDLLLAQLERVRFELNHDRALSFCFDAFSSREPVSTSLENALGVPENAPNLMIKVV